jgi:hypothetical protein
MSLNRKKANKGTVGNAPQQVPCKDSCRAEGLPAPTKANKITLGLSLAILLAWIAFLAFLALGK